MMIKMTRQLREQISNSVSRSFNDREIAANAKRPSDDEVAQAVYDAKIAPYNDLMKGFPDGFFWKGSSIRVRVGGSEKLGIDANHFNGSLTTVGDVCLPHEVRAISVSWDDLPVDLATRYKEAIDESKQIYEQRRSLVKEVEALLTKCGTLKEFLTLWPTGAEFVPESVMEKHRAPEVRGRKKKGEKEPIEVKPSLDTLVSLNKLLS